MQSKQDFHEELQIYRLLAAETTDPIGLILLKQIIAEMEEIERRWDELKPEPNEAYGLKSKIVPYAGKPSEAYSYE